MKSIFPRVFPQILRAALWTALLIGVPLALAVYILGLKDWDLSIPLLYNKGDALWQFIFIKCVEDTGWVLTNPYLGAPEVAHWYWHSAAQTSALHSVLMLGLSAFVHDAVRLQQVYYLLNFPLICLTSFLACRLLGISRLLAFCVGLLFAFTTFRIGVMLYVYLTSYFMVPLALVAVIWVLSGKFAALVKGQERSSGWRQSAARLVRRREFLLGLLFVALTAMSDGYYAFFTLLLLGFAAFARILLGDWRSPLSLLPVGTYILALVAVALLLTLPLHNYKKTHRSEFYPNGIEDPVLIKHPFEAEVYSASLKLLVAPIPQHHIRYLGRIGQWMNETSDGAKLFKGVSIVPLGTLASLLFGIALVLLTIPALRRRMGGTTLNESWGSESAAASQLMGDALLSLTLFIFLCAISGGIGTLIALVYPTIRAYDRFAIFLIFVLYLGAAWFVTPKLQRAGRRGKIVWVVLILTVTVAALYDQIPNDARKGSKLTKATFLAERQFVQKVEAALAPNAMVYHYPYAQYLRESKYYGWSSFAGSRLYLHSHQLRWSNGGAKNSPADDWNFRISQLPPDNLIAEVEAVGFSGFVIDGTVVKADEYRSVLQAFANRGYTILEDAPSQYTFVQLRDPGFRLFYDPTYREADHIVVTDPARLARSEFPGLIEGEALSRFVNSQSQKVNSVIRKADHPELFSDSSAVTRGLGQSAIVPLSDMLGKFFCTVEAGPQSGSASDMLRLTVSNQSRFDWKMGDGPFPIRIGVHIRQQDGKLLRWDDGFRVPADAYIRQGTSHTFRLPLNALPLGAEVRASGTLVAEFALVQDGHAWFGNINCSVPLR